MSNQLIYNEVEPESLKPTYVEYDQVDFVLSNENQALSLGSVLFCGDLTVNNAGADDAARALQYFDTHLGAHSFIDTLSITFEKKGGNVEVINDYPRYVKMVREASVAKDEYDNSNYLAELCAPGQSAASVLIVNKADTQKQQFSVNLTNCLNKVVDNPFLNMNEVGSIRVSMRLNRNVNVFYGIQTNMTYELSNLTMNYLTVPDESKGKPTTLNTVSGIKQNINTSRANVSTRMPTLCNAVMASFQRVSKLNVPQVNNYNLEKIPNVKEVIYMFNNSYNQVISYSLTESAEMLKNYIEAAGKASGKNNVRDVNFYRNDSYGLGINFGEIINLANNKISIQLTSEIEENTMMFLYFNGFVQL